MVGLHGILLALLSCRRLLATIIAGAGVAEVKVATVDNWAHGGRGPQGPITVLAADLLLVTHTPEKEYGNMHAVLYPGVQTMLRGSQIQRHQQPWEIVHWHIDG